MKSPIRILLLAAAFVAAAAALVASAAPQTAGTEAGATAVRSVSSTSTSNFNSPSPAAPAPATVLAGERVLWMGDSITQAGSYVTFVEYYLARAYPQEKFDLISIGLNSETVSGLTESTHGAIRPCALDRLPRALELVKPTVVVACYGMNDGIYHPPSMERQKAFEKGMMMFIKLCRAANARVILITPPPFDCETSGRNLQPLGAPVYGYSSPYEAYDAALSWMSIWETRLPRRLCKTVDLHSFLTDFIVGRRRDEPKFILSPDAVHPSEFGHLIMARFVLGHLGFDLPSSVADLDTELARIQADPLYPLIKQRREKRSDGWRAAVGLPSSGPNAEADCAKLQVQIDALRAK